MSLPMHKERRLLYANQLLLTLSIALLILTAFIPAPLQNFVSAFLLTGIFLTSIYVGGSSSPRLIAVVVLLVVLQWVAHVIEREYLALMTAALNSIYILYLVVRMAIQFSSAQRVTTNTLLIAVNGYLLIGLTCALYALLIAHLAPDSFYVARENAFLSADTQFHTFAYYAFINMSTVGFGDIIPVTNAGRALAVLLAVTGPLYIAIVIAFLVGKYAGGK